MTPDTATSIAISGLQFIAGDEEQISRFIALTGISPDEMRLLLPVKILILPMCKRRFIRFLHRA